MRPANCGVFLKSLPVVRQFPDIDASAGKRIVVPCLRCSLLTTHRQRDVGDARTGTNVQKETPLV